MAFALERACSIAFDGDLRVLLADQVFKAGKTSATSTATFSDGAGLLARHTTWNACVGLWAGRIGSLWRFLDWGDA